MVNRDVEIDWTTDRNYCLKLSKDEAIAEHADGGGGGALTNVSTCHYRTAHGVMTESDGKHFENDSLMDLISIPPNASIDVKSS